MTKPRRIWHSIGAVFLGFLVVAILSLGTDEIFHVLKIYPPWDEPMPNPMHNVLALSYRIVYGILGGNVTARFAPRNPMRHALIGGAIGLVLSTAGAIATIPMNLGPSWYPIAIAVTALPCAWAGGALFRPRT
jgi:hypothetical protein